MAPPWFGARIVGMVGADLIEQFDDVARAECAWARSRNPTGLMGYSFNWSPEGVVNEYINDCRFWKTARLAGLAHGMG